MAPAPATVSDGTVWVLLGITAGTHTVDDATGWRVGERASDALGAGLAGGDLNADGVGDLIVGAPGAGMDGQGAGEVLLLYGGG